MPQLRTKIQSLMLTLIAGLIFTSTAFGTATIVIENGDPAGVGFNDSTPASPVGGNPGTTVGQQRLNAFQFAANVWGAALNSGPTITIHASWAPLACSASSGTLGSAGAVSIFRDFPGSVPGTWYGEALANALSNNNLNASAAEISAQFNMSVGSPGCLETLHWYYGLDTNTGAGGINLVAVLLHEFSHGLGFQTFTNSGTGAQASGFPSIYDRFLFDNTTAKIWPQMTNAERAASAINTNHLVWNGPQVVADAPTVLGTPQLRVNTPPAIAGNYQVGTADFGAQLTTAGVTAGVVQAVDPANGAGPATTDACSSLTNAAAVSGNIALIDRGSCDFTVKVKNAQDAGAVGVMIADNVAGSPPPALGGSDPTITIPAVRITMADGNTIKAQLGSGVNATLLINGSTPAGATVVSLDATRTNAVRASRRAYDGMIAGVVSAKPGVILGEAGMGKVMVTMSGRVIVKVDASKYPIRIGDLLVTSNKPGVAMRSRPLRVGGKLIHRPGTIIGKALEALPGGEGKILVLVSLQ